MATIYAHDPFGSYNDPETLHLQVVALSDMGATFDEIADITGYALSTVRQYVKKFFDTLIDKAREFFGKVKKTAKRIIQGEYEIGPCAYILELFDSNENIVWLKVGKTDNINARLKQLPREYRKKGADIADIKVCKQIMCETSDDALTMENTLRKHYKKKPAMTYIKNDRFTGVRYNKEDIENDEIINAQFALLAA